MKLPETFVSEKDAIINVVVETPRGSRNKFTYDFDSGFFRLGKVLPAGTAFPLDFGFLPGTRGEDGDPLDALVLLEQATYPGCLLECRLIGVIQGEQTESDEDGYIRNDRLIAIPTASVDYKHFRTLSDFGDERMRDLFHFFKYYHNMDGGDYRSVGNGDADTALNLIKEGKE